MIISRWIILSPQGRENALCSTLVRIVASLLLAIFSFALISPALDSGPESSLPLCCQRNGKHHCAMQEVATASPGRVGFRTAKQKCLSRPKLGSSGIGRFFTLTVGGSPTVPDGRHLLEAPRTVWPQLRPGTNNFGRGPPPSRNGSFMFAE